MIVASIADIHARGQDLENLRAVLDQATEACKDHGVQVVALVGDQFERPNIHDDHASTGAIAAVMITWLRALTVVARAVVAISGNHDIAGAGSQSAMRVLDGLGVAELGPNGAFDCGGGQDNLMIYGVPWEWSGSKTVAERIRDMDPGNHRNPRRKGGDAALMLLGHFRVAGAKMSATRICEGEGWSITEKELKELAGGYDRVVLGDFHARQDSLAGESLGGYVGALRQLNHGEEANAAGFEIWDTQTGLVKWIDLGAATQYRTVEWTEDGTPPEMIPGYKTRVICPGWTPGEAIASPIEEAGGRIEAVLMDTERSARVEEIADGIVDRPRELIALYGGTKDWTPEYIAELEKEFDELTAATGGN